MNETLIEQIQADASALDIKITTKEKVTPFVWSQITGKNHTVWTELLMLLPFIL